MSLKKFIYFIIIIICSNNSLANDYSLYRALDLYGYKNESQKAAIENLMHYAQIIPPTQTFNNYYPLRHNPSELTQDIIHFVKKSQKHFFIRHSTQERWEIEQKEWMSNHRIKIREDLQELGFVEEVLPNIQKVDAICILGARKESMEKRLNYAIDLFNKNLLSAKYLILLAGERKLLLKIDGEEQELLKIAKHCNIENLNELTETHLIEWLYKNSSFYNKLKTFVINTPVRNLPRPTTETTILELINWLDEHKDIKRIAFVSNQPYVKYQKAIISQVIKTASADISFEVIGPAVKDNIEPLNLLEAFGSYILAQTPTVLVQLNNNILSEKSINKLKKLYLSQPLIFSNIEKLFHN